MGYKGGGERERSISNLTTAMDEGGGGRQDAGGMGLGEDG